MPETARDLARIAQQEQQLRFPHFSLETAWKIGLRLRETAVARNHVVAIDVRRFSQQLFFTALDGTSPSNGAWIRRKSNTVAHFLRSSYAIALELEAKKTTLAERHALPAAEYAADGGSFPLITEAGVIGSITVSGLSPRSDHELVVETLCAELGLHYDELRLEPA